MPLDKSQLETLTLDEGSTASLDRKSTRLNSSHSQISYAVFCLKKKKSHLATRRTLFQNLVVSELLNPTLTPLNPPLTLLLVTTRLNSVPHSQIITLRRKQCQLTRYHGYHA